MESFIKRIVSLFIILFSCFTSQSQSLNLNWGQQYGTNGWDWVSSIIASSDNHYIIAGGVPGNLFVEDSTEIYMSNATDAFIACFDSVGNLSWQHTFGSLFWENIQSIIEMGGNIYAAGCFQDSIDFDGFNLPPPPFLGSFIASFNNDGSLRWIKNLFYQATIYSIKLTVEDTNSFFVACSYKDTLSIEGIDLITDETPDLLIARIDTSGNVQNYNNIVFGGSMTVSDILANESQLFTSGSFSDTMELNDTILVSHGRSDAWLISFSDSLTPIWYRTYGNWGDDAITALAQTHDQKLLFAGTFEETILLDSVILNSQGCIDLFLGKMDDESNLLWCRQAGGYSNDLPIDIQINSDSNIYLLGAFSGDIKIWPIQNALDSLILLSSGSQSNAFLSCYNHEGELYGAFTCPGTSEDYGKAFAIDKDDNLIIAGNFNLNMQLQAFNDDRPAHQYSAKGGHDVFLAKYSDPCKENSYNVGFDTLICPGIEILLDAGENYKSYCWNNGLSKERYLSVKQTGKYIVTVLTNSGCLAIDTFNISYYPEPKVFAGNDTVVVGQRFVPIDASVSSVESISWRVNGEGSLINPDSLYTVYMPTIQSVKSEGVTLYLEGVSMCKTVVDDLNLRFIDTKNEVIAFPNPTFGEITFKLINAKDEIKSIEVKTLNGLSISLQCNDHSSSYKASFFMLPPGTYIASINTLHSSYRIPFTIIL